MSKYINTIDKILKSSEKFIGKEFRCWVGQRLDQRIIDKMRLMPKEVMCVEALDLWMAMNPVIWPVQSDSLPTDDGGCNFSERVALFTDSEESSFYAYTVPNMVKIIKAQHKVIKEVYEYMATCERMVSFPNPRPITIKINKILEEIE